jgi:hypothetical protein
VVDARAGLLLVNCGIDDPERIRTQQLVLDTRTGAVTHVGDEQTALFDSYYAIGAGGSRAPTTRAGTRS